MKNFFLRKIVATGRKISLSDLLNGDILIAGATQENRLKGTRRE
jgi:hypothetical protein